jgi:hypothetical protein
MQNTGLHDRQRPGRLDRFGQPFGFVAHGHARALDAAVLDLDEHLQPAFGTLTTGPDPQPQDVPFAINSDSYGCVDGPVRDLTVADLDDEGVNEDHWMHAIQRPVLLSRHLAEDPVDYLRDRLT